jgi:hypothetical protein
MKNVSRLAALDADLALVRLSEPKKEKMTPNSDDCSWNEVAYSVVSKLCRDLSPRASHPAHGPY